MNKSSSLWFNIPSWYLYRFLGKWLGELWKQFKFCLPLYVVFFSLSIIYLVEKSLTMPVTYRIAREVIQIDFKLDLKNIIMN